MLEYTAIDLPSILKRARDVGIEGSCDAEILEKISSATLYNIDFVLLTGWATSIFPGKRYFIKSDGWLESIDKSFTLVFIKKTKLKELNKYFKERETTPGKFVEYKCESDDYIQYFFEPDVK